VALWSVDRCKERIGVTYTNLHTGSTFDCGQADPNAFDQVFEFIATESQPGDLVAVNGVVVALIQHPAAA
jgi:hypothetical protein